MTAMEEVDSRKPATVSRGYSWEGGGHEELEG